MHSVAVSPDNSLLAVGTGSCVTLWCATDGVYLASLASPVTTEDITFPLLAFVPGTPFLAGAIPVLHIAHQNFKQTSNPRSRGDSTRSIHTDSLAVPFTS